MSLFLTVLKAVWCCGEMEGGGGTQINRDVGIALGLLRKGEVASDRSPNQGRLVQHEPTSANIGPIRKPFRFLVILKPSHATLLLKN
jgi:hypothetical protein